MKIGYTVLIFVIFISGLNSEAISNEMPLTEIILKVQDRLNQTTSIRSEFEQKNFIKSLGARTTSRGFLYIKKPEKIKIQYIKPQKQVFVSNENSIWIYTPKFKQVLHRKISITKQNINPIIFLSKKINLSKEIFLEFSIEYFKFETDKSPHPSKFDILL